MPRSLRSRSLERMKNVHTAPLEILAPKSNGTFVTEPYEAGWADEALAIVYARECAGPAPHLELRPQISADGVRWMDHGAAPLVLEGEGGGHIAFVHFGNWLRLVGAVRGGPADGTAAFVLDIYWVLKG